MKGINKTFKTVVLFITLSCVGVNAQTSNDNYVKVYKANAKLQGDISLINDKDKVSETIEYFDGLGRSIQTSIKRGSPAGYDIVTFMEYDDFGKSTKKYLPFIATSTDGSLLSNPGTQQSTFYQNLYGADGAYAFTMDIIEKSDVNKVIKKSAPGLSWQYDGNLYGTSDHTVKQRYLTNNATDVIHFTYDLATNQVSFKAGSVIQYYQSKELSLTKTIDEHQNDILEFKDKEGRVVCKKVKANQTEYAQTYYLYDDFGNLVLVLSPEAVKSLIEN